MKKKNLAHKIHLLVLTTMLSMMLFGCGNSQTESTPATAANEQEPAVAEETTVEETSADQEKQDVNENTSNEEEPYEAPVSSMIDWETFAAQENTEDICLAISNETISVQSVLYEGGFYAYREGDRIAIPIRNSIQRITYFTSNEDGTQKGEIKELYRNDEEDIENKEKYIEFEIGKEAGYYILISSEANETITFCISTIAEID